MTEFIAPEFKKFLAMHQSDNFEALWERRDAWVDEPNFGRGKAGWSGVCRIEFEGKGFYLKKQENFFTYSIRHPFGISVAEKEFKNLKYCAEKNIPALKAVYFGVRKVGSRFQAMIMTEELANYYDLEQAVKFLNANENKAAQKRKLIAEIALLIRDAHRNNFMHNALYPKHIFVAKNFLENDNEGVEPKCRFIDLEKGLISKWGSKKQLRDLETLKRRAPQISKADQVYFLLCYLNLSKCNEKVRQLISNIRAISKS